MNNPIKGINLLKNDIKENHIGIILVILYCAVMHVLFHYVCPFRLFTGIPCPGCGLTRAGLALIRLDFKGVFYYNPVIIPIAAFIIYVVFCRYVLGKKVRYAAGILVLLALALFGLYFYRIITLFPDKKPMEYVANNLLSPIYRIVKEYLR